MSSDLAGWAREQQRLNVLIAARRTRQAEIESGLATERTRTAELSVQARSLKELLDRMEGEVASARRAAEEARAARPARPAPRRNASRPRAPATPPA